MAGPNGEEPPGQQVGEPTEPSDCGLQNKVPALDLYNASLLGADEEAKKEAGKRYFKYGERPAPLPSFRGPVESPPATGHKTGICCSGGGIRSAAFNLGALQSLQEKEELQKAKYLAAVSGGSYIAAAFSMVAKRWPDPDKLDGELAKKVAKGEITPEQARVGREKPWTVWDDSDPALFGDGEKAPFAPNSPEEQFLRNRSSYMASDGSAKVYLAVRLLLGLLTNLLLLAIPVAAISIIAGLVVQWPYEEVRGGTLDWHRPLWVPPAFVLVIGLLWAWTHVANRPRNDQVRARGEAWATRLVIGATGLAILLLALPAVAAALVEFAEDHEEAARATTGGAGLASIAGLLAGVLAYMREVIGFVKKAGTSTKDKLPARVAARMRKALPTLAGAVAGPLLFFVVAAVAMAFTFDNAAEHPVRLSLAAGAGLLISVVAYFFLDITSMSLHHFYKRRLCTAFSIKRVGADAVSKQRDDAHIGQDAKGVAVERDFDELVALSDTALDNWPALIVCAAANVSDPAATPPGRRVTSFTFSANTVGGPLVGGMDTESFENSFQESSFEVPERWHRFREDRRVGRWLAGDGRLWKRASKRVGRFFGRWVDDAGRARDFSLPAAVAVSGAAVSPSMGKETPRSLTFLLALANIRLGVWVPNPRWVAHIDATEDAKERRRELRHYGRPRPKWLVKELLGRNRVDGKYLYVSDGGHYENLGLVELLRRGCTRIFCFDASGGKFAALGDAIALARSELDVEIELDPGPLTPKGDPPTAERETATGTITYANGRKGVIVYARNVMPPNMAWDVRAHQVGNPVFPHDSTADQLYTDQKFEAYRKLGSEAGKRAVERMSEVAPLDAGGVDPNHAMAPDEVNLQFAIGSIQIVDLREDFARDTVRIDGAHHVPERQLERARRHLSQERRIVFVCDEGKRSQKAAERLRAHGFEAYWMAGGMKRWAEDGFPAVRGGPPPVAIAPERRKPPSRFSGLFG